ncbi:hypothetical protein RUR49_17825 [Pseudoxanthobacter sp. M-2]|uniref:hypothetical protein n=1 Tax=Pseudoxanthobacter sp. M-2 TaxID=3078754 RepID=UPI0038FC5986
MTNASPAIHELFMLRMQIVQEISRLNSRHLYDRQVFGGCEMEVLRCERDASPDGSFAAEALATARERFETARLALRVCDEELADWHARLDELDSRIAGS